MNIFYALLAVGYVWIAIRAAWRFAQQREARCRDWAFDSLILFLLAVTLAIHAIVEALPQ